MNINTIFVENIVSLETPPDVWWVCIIWYKPCRMWRVNFRNDYIEARDSGRALWLLVVSAYLQWVMLQWIRSHGRWLPGPLVQSVPAGGLCGSLPGVHESMDLVRCIGKQPIAATLLVASKISLRLLWWPPTEHQCVLIYRCVFTHVCCWLFSVGNKVTTTTTEAGIWFSVPTICFTHINVTTSTRICSFRCSKCLVLALTDTGEALYWGWNGDRTTTFIPRRVEYFSIPREVFSWGRYPDSGGTVYMGRIILYELYWFAHHGPTLPLPYVRGCK